MRITTDIDGLERVAPPGTSVRAIPQQQVPSRIKRNFLLLREAVRSDHLVIHFLLPEVIFFSVFLFLIPGHRCRFTTLDFFIGTPRPWLLPLVRWSIGRVDRLLVYFRDPSVFGKLFGLPVDKFVYIPFKVNAWELLQATPATDGGYIFSGGRSRRDFATFFAAVEPLGYPVKMLTGRQADLAPHGSTLDGLRVPPNVEILFNDSSAKYFVQTLAASRLVVIPIVPDSTTQAGIGVYLQAMAARKCLIVSAGLGVSDVLDPNDAMIVPPGDVEALRHAIQTAWEQADVRNRYAEAGYRYATVLGGEDTLRKNVLARLPLSSAT